VEPAPTANKDVQLLEKTIAELNNVDPFDDEVHIYISMPSLFTTM